MNERPNLSLPEAAAVDRRRRGGRFLGPLAVLLLLAILALQIHALVRPAAAPAAPSAAAGGGGGRDASSWKELAIQASQRNLHAAAASAWRTHLEAIPEANRDERGKVCYQLGIQLMQAGSYEEAVLCFWQADKLLGGSHELASSITDRIAESLERLGKFAEKARELRERVGVGSERGAADKIAAEIGIDKIALHDLDDRIAREIDLQLSNLTALAPDLEQQVRKQFLDQYADPQKKLAKLYEIVGQQLLYRRGRELKLDEDPDIAELLYHTRIQLVANAVLARELRDRIKPTEGDLRTYFAAHRDEFRSPPRATARIVPAESKEAAEKLIAAGPNEDALAAAATAGGKDRSVVAEKIGPGDPIPGLGPVPAVSEAIFSAKEPGLIPKPIEADGGWFAVHVRAIEPAHAAEYDAVRGRVLNQYVQEKQRELQQAFVQKLFQEYGAIIHDDVVLGKTAPAPPATPSAPTAPQAPAGEREKKEGEQGGPSAPAAPQEKTAQEKI